MTTKAEDIVKLAGYFRRNGYVRPAAARRAAGVGYGRFRRGFEVRLTAASREELRWIRSLLKRLDFVPGKPFVKSNQWRQPVYGRENVERLLALIGEPGLGEAQPH